MSSALSAACAAPEQIVVIGPAEEATDTLWRAANASYRPFATLLRTVPGAQQEQLASELPWIAGMTTREGRPAAYVCRSFACETPTTEPDDLVVRIVGTGR